MSGEIHKKVVSLFENGLGRSEINKILKKEFKDKSDNAIRIIMTRAAKEVYLKKTVKDNG